MYGLEILVRALSQPAVADRHGNLWQYHSRSDRHSKVACWAVAFELLQRSALLRRHVAANKVVFGVNHAMNDFKTRRKKKLDLVIARPELPLADDTARLADLAARWDIVLTEEERALLATLPLPRVAAVGSVLVALEAKACMTAHVKSLPRLYDELNSSHLTVHGASEQALAVGFAMVNAATRFVSPGLNSHALATVVPVVSTHPQPRSAQRTVEKLCEIPRRSGPGQEGFDALGIVLVDMVNDGSPVTLHTAPPAPARGDVFSFEQMLDRVVHGYDVAFSHI
jgi:hypothetical protein